MVQIAIVTDNDTFNIDIDSDTTILGLKATIEANLEVPTYKQVLQHGNQRLDNDSKNLRDYDIKEGDIIYMTIAQPQRQNHNGSSLQRQQGVSDDEIEGIRQKALSDPSLLRQMEFADSELAKAVHVSRNRFRDVFRESEKKRREVELEKARFELLAATDPFNPEVQKRIEESIRQEAIYENLDHAIENIPESFGQVHMLYVPIEVNGIKLKGFVDSGAQLTIMSPATAEKCNLMRLLDTRFSGTAMGVGTAKILGRVHSTQLCLGRQLYLPASITVVDQPNNHGPDFIIGLDMLRRHQCKINLESDALEIRGESIPFLPQSETPGFSPPVPFAPSSTPSTSQPEAADAATRNGTPADQTKALATQAKPAAPQVKPPVAESGSPSTNSPLGISSPSVGNSMTFPEESIRQLMDLGCSRSQALQLLQASNGQLEIAASLLFS